MERPRTPIELLVVLMPYPLPGPRLLQGQLPPPLVLGETFSELLRQHRLRLEQELRLG